MSVQPNVHVNSFVLRQTEESEFSHYTGSWGFLKHLVKLVMDDLVPGYGTRQGYREGVLLVDVPPDNFFSGVVELKEGDQLIGTCRARKEGETPRKSVGVVGAQKLAAKSAFIVLYASSVLAEDGDNELPPKEGNWEIISINASPCEGEMPISPGVLMHNHFGSDGGTATHLSDSEFVTMLRKSFEFWKNKGMVAPKISGDKN